MTKREVLASLNFGQRIAEDEAEVLASYFVETDQWRKVVSGQVDIVYGPKGSGKSAIYSLLRQKRDDLLAKGIIAAAGENVRGAPAFEDLVADPPASEEQFRGLWKLYFLSIVGAVFQIVKFDDNNSQSLLATLAESGLLTKADEKWSLNKVLRAAMAYVRRFELSGEIKVNPTTGMPEGVGGKITLREPAPEQERRGYISTNSLLQLADNVLRERNMQLWIVLDRLDVAFAESAELEGNALRALFRAYRDLKGLNNFKLKIFLRDDIWKRITDEGFREASHITSAINIVWEPRALLNLVVRRALHNQNLRSFYNVNASEVLSDFDQQLQLFYRMFPPQVDAGQKKPNTFDWMVTRTADGTRQTAPRELVHLLSASRDEQLRLLEMGNPDPPAEMLFTPAALKGALPEVSKVRFTQTLCAEHPKLKQYMQALEAEKTEQTPGTLAKIWKTTEAKALTVAESLSEIGFFEKRGTKEQPSYWVPFLYRDALNLVQGTAE